MRWKDEEGQEPRKICGFFNRVSILKRGCYLFVWLLPSSLGGCDGQRFRRSREAYLAFTPFGRPKRENAEVLKNVFQKKDLM